MSIIIGIDPGIRRCGYAIIQNANNKKDSSYKILDAAVIINEREASESYTQYIINDTKLDDNRRMRISRMHDTFHHLISKLKPYQKDISAIGIEQFYFMTRTQQHAEFLYGLRGALMMHALTHGRPLYDVGPTEMKKYITGWGTANKARIHTMITHLYQLDTAPQYADISDALGIAYVTAKMSKN